MMPSEIDIVEQRKKSRMTPSKKAGVRQHGRDKVGAPRRHYLITTVTQDEKDAILKYCERHNKSISAFLAEIALEDAKKPAKTKEGDQEITITLKLPARDIDKMQLVARLEQKRVEDLMREMLEPLRKRKAITALEMHTLRCWLSNDEHRTITKFLAKHGLSARSYLALLALRTIDHDR